LPAISECVSKGTQAALFFIADNAYDTPKINEISAERKAIYPVELKRVYGF